jgi:dTMP kinase
VAAGARRMTAGKFITFEGGEGSGKSTQARLLVEALKARGDDVVLTREPGGSPFAERVRAVILDPATPPHAALSEALLFYAARADHLARTIRPALAAGRWVVCDRFSDSTRVYQGHAGTLDPGLIEALERMIVAPTRPDLTVVIDLPASEGLARAQARRNASEPAPAEGSAPRAEDPYEARDIAFHERLREGFLAIAEAEPQRCVVVDGRLAASEVAARVWAEARRRLIPESP